MRRRRVRLKARRKRSRKGRRRRDLFGQFVLVECILRGPRGHQKVFTNKIIRKKNTEEYSASNRGKNVSRLPREQKEFQRCRERFMRPSAATVSWVTLYFCFSIFCLLKWCSESFMWPRGKSSNFPLSILHGNWSNLYSEKDISEWMPFLKWNGNSTYQPDDEHSCFTMFGGI